MDNLSNCSYSNPLTFDGTPPLSAIDIWQYASSTCISNGSIGFSPTTTISTSSDITVYGYMSSGEVLIALLLFLSILLSLSQMIAQGLNKVNTKRQFLGYGGGDVEIRYDL